MDRLKISIDSGAYSLYNAKFSPNKKGLQSDRDKADYSFYKHPDFKKYLEEYIAFLNENKDRLEMYVCLDIIYNPKASWEIQKYMESCGLMPVPVFHFGEEWKWLERYLDNYEYVGIGGLGQRATMKSYLDFGDGVFKRACNKHGTPQTKLHGFAMTSIQLMKRYPWYSCDSSTWVSLSRNGWARFPRLDRRGNYSFLDRPIAWRFTERASHTRVHINKQQQAHKELMARYLQEKFGMTMEDMKDYLGRDICNIGHVLQVGVRLKHFYEEKYRYPQGGNIYLAGTGILLTNVRTFKRMITKASRTLPKDYNRHYLGSFYYRQDCVKVISALETTKRRKVRGLR